MKLYTRDRITTLLGIGLLSMLVVCSYYYAVKTDLELTKTIANKDSPDFTTQNVAITTFKEDGSAKNRLFADYAEHFSDGRTNTVKPRFVSLEIDKPQTKASADRGTSMDDGETVFLTGNVVLTRAGDKSNAPLRITTQEATIWPDTGIAESTVYVQIESGSDLHSGTGMHFDNVDRTLELKSDVHTIIMPRNQRK